MAKSCNTLQDTIVQESCKATILETGNNLIVIYFFSEWCQPCRIMCEEMDKLAKKDVVSLSVDVTQERTASINFHEVTDACGQVDKLKEAIKAIKMQKVQNETELNFEAEKEDSWLKGLVWSSINPIFPTWLS